MNRAYGLQQQANAGRQRKATCRAVDVYESKETVLRILTERFPSHAERIPRFYRKAGSLQSGNPSFRGYSAKLKGFS
ncbi:MAG: hypothetical protein ABSA46_12705 [Thermodesulfovibrionales bacterium]|jgi:hypothetical protein